MVGTSDTRAAQLAKGSVVGVDLFPSAKSVPKPLAPVTGIGTV